ncbi:hypothetical protein Nmel_012065 [Mimus melanotis]
MTTIPNFKWQNLNEIRNVHLSKFLPPLIPVEAEVGSGSPCWCLFSVLHIQVAQETWKQGKQIVLVCSGRGFSGMLLAPSARGFIIKMLIKIPTFLSLSHPWPCAAFCFLRKVPGCCSAENGNSPGIPGKLGVSPKPPALERQEGHQHPSKLDWERPGRTGVSQKRESSAAQDL